MRVRSLCSLLLVVGLLSCGKKAPVEEVLEPPPAPPIYGAPIAVLFAYGYNDAGFLAETKALIQERFSSGDELVNADDIMAPLVFPDDFPNERISLLYNKIYNEGGNTTVSALVLLGSPENTHRALARLRDTWETQGGAIPVVSLFSQDDVLATEAESDAAVDFAPPPEGPVDTDQDEESTDSRRISPATLVQILVELHRRIATTAVADTIKAASDVLTPDTDAAPDAVTGTPETAGSLFAGNETVAALFGPEYVVTAYHDAETGLIAANHFLVDFAVAP